MTIHYAVAGDNNSVLTETLAGVTDLNDVGSIAVHLKDTAPAGTSYPLTGTVADAASNKVQVVIPAALNLPAGDYLMEWQVTFVDGSIFTWPGDGYDTLRVRPQLA